MMSKRLYAEDSLPVSSSGHWKPFGLRIKHSHIQTTHLHRGQSIHSTWFFTTLLHSNQILIQIQHSKFRIAGTMLVLPMSPISDIHLRNIVTDSIHPYFYILCNKLWLLIMIFIVSLDTKSTLQSNKRFGGFTPHNNGIALAFILVVFFLFISKQPVTYWYLWKHTVVFRN